MERAAERLEGEEDKCRDRAAQEEKTQYRDKD